MEFRPILLIFLVSAFLSVCLVRFSKLTLELTELPFCAFLGYVIESAEAAQPGSSVAGAPVTPAVSMPAAPKSPTAPAPAPANGFARVTWQGDVPPQKWMNFYTKVLSKFATQAGLRIGLNVEIAPQGGVSPQKVDEIKVALRELGLPDNLGSESQTDV